MDLSSQQKEIVDDTVGNIVVSASAGTGKTRTLIAKIYYDMLKNNTYKTIAAITFTIRAAQEIRDRINFDSSQCFIGTNNSFAIEEVIKPFLKDVYGQEYDIDIDTDYTNREHKLTSLNEGLLHLKQSHTIYSYKDNKRNFVFDLALDIVTKSEACRLYLQAKYFGIYIDEYQDCDVDMHRFFMFLCYKLKILTFIVGDEKQSIYRWRGAEPDLFKSLFTLSGFTHKILDENHRSNKQIQDYSNLLFPATRALISHPCNENNIFWVTASNDTWAAKVMPFLDSAKTSALLRSQKEHSLWTHKDGASEGASLLTQAGLEHIYIPPTPIDEITTITAWLYTAIASFILLETYSIYDFINEIPTETLNSSIQKIKSKLKEIQECSTNQESFSQKVIELAEYLNYPTKKEHIDSLYETITSPRYAVALSPEKPSHCTLTFHSSKGLEFDQVILFAEDYAHNGNVSAEHINNHYVACTRAKEKLIIIDTKSPDAVAVKEKIWSFLSAENIPYNSIVTLEK